MRINNEKNYFNNILHIALILAVLSFTGCIKSSANTSDNTAAGGNDTAVAAPESNSRLNLIQKTLPIHLQLKPP